MGFIPERLLMMMMMIALLLYLHMLLRSRTPPKQYLYYIMQLDFGGFLHDFHEIYLLSCVAQKPTQREEPTATPSIPKKQGFRVNTRSDMTKSTLLRALPPGGGSAPKH